MCRTEGNLMQIHWIVYERIRTLKISWKNIFLAYNSFECDGLWEWNWVWWVRWWWGRWGGGQFALKLKLIALWPVTVDGKKNINNHKDLLPTKTYITGFPGGDPIAKTKIMRVEEKIKLVEDWTNANVKEGWGCSLSCSRARARFARSLIANKQKKGRGQTITFSQV